MPQNPGDIPLPTEDVPMFNPPNGQFAIPASVQAQPTPLTETGFGDAVLQELMQSRRSQEQLMEQLSPLPIQEKEGVRNWLQTPNIMMALRENWMNSSATFVSASWLTESASTPSARKFSMRSPI